MEAITKEQIGTPILAADALLAVLKKDKKGIFLGIYVTPEDVTDAVLRLNLGDVMRVFITVPDIGA